VFYIGEEMIKYEDIEVGDLIWLDESAVSYSTTSSETGIIKGYEKYLKRPVEITEKCKKGDNVPEFVVDGKFGIYTKNIKEKIKKEKYPEYFV
jgi:hypothetical protein